MKLRKSFNATKIICTLGPASSNERVIEQLIREGMSVARLNFSHGSHDFHLELIRKVRRVAEKLGTPVGVLQDLCGPKIRVGSLQQEAVRLKTGSIVTISASRVAGDSNRFSINTPRIIPELKSGDRVLIDDGRLSLKVLEPGARGVRARVVSGGVLRTAKGINLPDSGLTLPSLTAKDRRDLEFGLRQGVDLIALSFVRSAGDVRKLKSLIKRSGHDVPVFAKLEKPEAVGNLDKIMAVADGIMVARGDLGVELPLEQVPVIQKRVILAARESLKPVIVATQMLESMTTNHSPTRAEASDVANAIFDGTDCVMLSGETAAGSYPVAAVKMMSSIISATESQTVADSLRVRDRRRPGIDFARTVAESAAEMAREIDARMVACFTKSGLTARLISKQGSTIPLVAFTTERRVLNRLSILRGVLPRQTAMIRSIDQMITEVERRLKGEKLVGRGDRIVIVASAPVAVGGETNMLKLHQID